MNSCTNLSRSLVVKVGERLRQDIIDAELGKN